MNNDSIPDKIYDISRNTCISPNIFDEINSMVKKGVKFHISWKLRQPLTEEIKTNIFLPILQEIDNE